MGQPFIKDDKQTIEKMLAAKKTKVNGYAFLVVGEGIEKAQPRHYALPIDAEDTKGFS